jgi:hypothetical protein
MDIQQLNDPAKVEEIKAALRKAQHFFGVDLTAGQHDELGPVILIESKGGALLIADKARSVAPSDEPTLDPAFLDE